MKTGMTTLLLSALVGSLVLLGSGCSKKSVVPPESSSGSSTSGTGSDYSSGSSGGYSENNLPVEGTLDDTSSTGSAGYGAEEKSDDYKRLHGRSTEGLAPIYFAFDQATVGPDMVDRMVNNARYLAQIPNSYVIIEGNTDERGTNEYNLALGERRAQNTRQYLIDLGIASARIRTISYGEEKPLFTDPSDEAYSQNRRADFVVE